VLSRLLIVLPTLEGGGAERFNVELAVALRRKGHDCTIFCLNKRGALLERAAEAGVPVVAGSTYRGTSVVRLALSLLVGLPRLWKLIRRSDATIAGLEGVATVLTVPLAILARRPLLAEVQVDLDGKFARPGLIWGLLAVASRHCYPRCSSVVAISTGAAASVKRIGADVAVEVVPMAVNAERAEQLAGPRVAASDPPAVVAVGRLMRQKSFDLLIRAHATARRSEPHRLVILGEGEDRPVLEALVDELGVTDTVALPGFTPNPYAAMRSASALCLSSRYEGMPTVLLEALALGCPVIATDCSEGVRFALADGAHGALVEAGNGDALADALVAHLRRPSTLQVKAAAAVDWVKTERSFDAAADRYLELIRDAPARRRTPRPRLRPADNGAEAT
jgi:glycosyltransferase involved in cell wall biosynthesis